MNITSPQQEPIDTYHLEAKILALQKILKQNQQMQHQLSKIKESLRTKIIQCQQGFEINRIYLQRPVPRNVMGYINLIKKVPIQLQYQVQLRDFNPRDAILSKNLSSQNKETRAKMLPIKFSISKLPQNPQQIDFIRLAQGSPQYKNGLQVYKSWREHFYKPSQTKFFTWQDQLLVQKVRIYGDNWEKISTFFDGRTFQQLYYRFQYHSNKQFQKGRWTLGQNMKLIILVEHFGQKKWAQISKMLKQKSQIQVRQRFCNVLDPNITKNNWNQFQKEVLLLRAGEYQYQWSRMVKIPLFSGKTDNALWRKFRSLMIAKSDQQIKKQVVKEELVKILLKFKRQKQKKCKKNK